MASSTPRYDTVSRQPQVALAAARGRRPLRAFARRLRMGMAGGAISLLFLLVGVFAPRLMPYDPNRIDVQSTLQPPSLAHLLGTDNQGRDLLSRVIFGARMSSLISVTSVAFGAAVGVVLGILAGYYRTLDGPIMRLNDVLLAFPGIIVALTIVSVLGTGLENVIVAIAI